MSQMTTLPDQADVEPRPATASPLPLRTTLRLSGQLLVTLFACYAAAWSVIAAVPGADAHRALVAIVMLVVQQVAALALVRRALGRSGVGWADLGFTRPTHRLWHLLWQLPALLVLVGVVQMVVHAITGVMPTNLGIFVALGAHVDPLGVVVLVLSMVVLAPLWEESFFRGVVYGGLRRRWSVAAAAMTSGVVFAAAHAQPMALPAIVTLGIGLALLREFHRTLWASVITHAVVNTFAAASLLIVLAR